MGFHRQFRHIAAFRFLCLWQLLPNVAFTDEETSILSSENTRLISHFSPCKIENRQREKLEGERTVKGNFDANMIVNGLLISLFSKSNGIYE